MGIITDLWETYTSPPLPTETEIQEVIDRAETIASEPDIQERYPTAIAERQGIAGGRTGRKFNRAAFEREKAERERREREERERQERLRLETLERLRLERIEKARLAKEERERRRKEGLAFQSKQVRERARRTQVSPYVAQVREQARIAKGLRERAKASGVSVSVQAARERASLAGEIREEAKKRGVDISTPARERGFISKLKKESKKAIEVERVKAKEIKEKVEIKGSGEDMFKNILGATGVGIRKQEPIGFAPEVKSFIEAETEVITPIEKRRAERNLEIKNRLKEKMESGERLSQSELQQAMQLGLIEDTRGSTLPYGLQPLIKGDPRFQITKSLIIEPTEKITGIEFPEEVDVKIPFTKTRIKFSPGETLDLYVKASFFSPYLKTGTARKQEQKVELSQREKLRQFSKKVSKEEVAKQGEKIVSKIEKGYIKSGKVGAEKEFLKMYSKLETPEARQGAIELLRTLQQKGVVREFIGNTETGQLQFGSVSKIQSVSTSQPQVDVRVDITDLAKVSQLEKAPEVISFAGSQKQFEKTMKEVEKQLDVVPRGRIPKLEVEGRMPTPREEKRIKTGLSTEQIIRNMEKQSEKALQKAMNIAKQIEGTALKQPQALRQPQALKQPQLIKEIPDTLLKQRGITLYSQAQLEKFKPKFPKFPIAKLDFEKKRGKVRKTDYEKQLKKASDQYAASLLSAAFQQVPTQVTEKQLEKLRKKIYTGAELRPILEIVPEKRKKGKKRKRASTSNYAQQYKQTLNQFNKIQNELFKY